MGVFNWLITTIWQNSLAALYATTQLRTANAIPPSANHQAKANANSQRHSTLGRTSNRAGRPSREEQLLREDRVLDVALREFLAQGLNGANIETIARDAGVGKSTIYRKYGNKQGLLLAVAQRRMRELEDRWQEFAFDINDHEGTLYRIALMSHREWSGKSLPIYRIIYTEAERMPDIAKAVDEMSKKSAIRPVLEYFQQLQDREIIAVRDVAEAASLFLIIAAGAMRSFLIPVELDDEGRSQLARDAVKFFLHGYTKR